MASHGRGASFYGPPMPNSLKWGPSIPNVLGHPISAYMVSATATEFGTVKTWGGCVSRGSFTPELLTRQALASPKFGGTPTYAHMV